ncbi:MAG: ATP-binding cassette domain-containing protein [Bacteroidales bacterium]|nr:ATP-binding cassette domain-containing protein [Bacteroidales bacterium]
MLKVNHISKAFGEKRVIDDLSFCLELGEKAAVMGSNGAGKTTLMRIISGLLPADSGSVEWEGHRLTAADFAAIGYLPEERGLYANMKVEEQAIYMAQLKGMPLRAAKQSVAEWFERLGMSDWRHRYTGSLSKGMQQRLQFVVAVAHRPKLLLLDEPFSGFDEATSAILCREINSLSESGVAVLLATHNHQAAAELCTKIVQL